MKVTKNNPDTTEWIKERKETFQCIAKEEKMNKPIKCRVCDILFQPKSNKSVMCSEVCRQKYKREWSYDRYEKMKAYRNKNKTLIKCKQCSREFMPISYNRVFCTNKCRLAYRPPTRPKKPKKIQDKHIWKTTHPYRMFKVESRFEIELQKALEREELNEAISRYTQQGGEITKLKELPAPTLPSVGSREWEWETRVGLGFVGSEQINEPTYMDEERLEFILSR